MARYFHSDEEERHRILEEWADRAGAGTSPDDRVERLAEIYPKETSPALKEAILDALALAGTGEAFDALLAIHRAEADPDSREIAASALESVISDLAAAGEPADWERVAQGWERELPRDVRLAAIQAAMEGERSEMISRLQALSGDADPEVRDAVGQAIEWLDDP